MVRATFSKSRLYIHNRYKRYRFYTLRNEHAHTHDTLHRRRALEKPSSDGGGGDSGGGGGDDERRSF